MKILYDCFSCSPYYGSDEGIGWLWPYYMSRYHEVWALVRKDRRPDIEKYCKENNFHDVHFVYCDIPDWMNFYYRTGRWFLPYQFLWQWPAYWAAKKLHRKEHFDLVHHVSTNDFRLLGFLYKLNTPYIIGPIGGGQGIPQGLEYYAREHKKSELIRDIINKSVVHLPYYKNALQRASAIFFSNCETEQLLSGLVKPGTTQSILTEVALKNEETTGCNQLCTINAEETVFLWAGRMVYRKGIELLLDAVEQIPRELKWKLILCGDGPERATYEKRCNESWYVGRVVFAGRKNYDVLREYYQKSDAFVFPSIRETTGTVIIEAMANKLPVICLKQGGGALVINEKTGYLVAGNTRKEYVDGFASMMVHCIENKEEVKAKGDAAYQRVISKYTWEKNVKEMETVYNNLLNNR